MTPSARVEEQATLGLDSVVAGPLPRARLGDRVARGGEPRLAGATTIARDPRRGDLPAISIDARVGTRAVLG